tara:strand:+ start:570 stop:836 length:267 start_codon:yes stop_codon:yes gene_type:complete
MKYVLVNKSTDEIIDRVDLGSDVGLSGATTYFKGTKRLPNDEDFSKLWKVLSEKEYELNFKNNLQNRQLEKRKYEWWKDDEGWLDIDH